MEFREELRKQALGLRGNLPDDWENTAEVFRQSCLVHRLDRAKRTRRLCHGITQYKKVFKYSVVREMKELDRITGWLGIQHTEERVRCR